VANWQVLHPSVEGFIRETRVIHGNPAVLLLICDEIRKTGEEASVED
jgi:hypothetical protein